MVDEIPINDRAWRKNWFDVVMKQIEPIIIRFYNRYMENNEYMKILMDEGDDIYNIIQNAPRPDIKFYKGKMRGAHSYTNSENLIRINLNSIKDEREFTDDVIHEVTHWIMDKVLMGQLNSARDHHNHWYWIMYIEIMDWFGFERRTVT